VDKKDDLVNDESVKEHVNVKDENVKGEHANARIKKYDFYVFIKHY